MKSSLPKVLHEIAGLPIVGHVAKAVQGAGGSDIALVVGRGADKVETSVRALVSNITVHEQVERLGTGHAVLAAQSAIQRQVTTTSSWFLVIPRSSKHLRWKWLVRNWLAVQTLW